MGVQKLYVHFCTEGNEGLMHLEIQVIDVTGMSRPNEQEGFWIKKLNTCFPRGLNIREED